MRVFVYVDGDNVGTCPKNVENLLNKYGTHIAEFRLYFSFSERGDGYNYILSRFSQFQLIVMTLDSSKPSRGGRIIVPRSQVRADQLDFLIAYDVHLLSKEVNQDAIGVIVSNDGGFEVLIPYLRLFNRRLFQVDSLATLKSLLWHIDLVGNVNAFDDDGVLTLKTRKTHNVRYQATEANPMHLRGTSQLSQSEGECAVISQSAGRMRARETAPCNCCRVIRTKRLISHLARLGRFPETMSELYSVVRACYPHADYKRIRRAMVRLEEMRVVRMRNDVSHDSISVNLPIQFPLVDLPRALDDQIELVQHYLKVVCSLQPPSTLAQLQLRLSRMVKGGLSTGQVEYLIRNLLDAGVVRLQGRSVVYALGN